MRSLSTVSGVERHHDWAEQAEHDLGHIVPRAYFPWWGNAPAALLMCVGLHWLTPVLASPVLKLGVAVALFAWGAVLRRGPMPSLLRFWSATIAAIAAFLLLLILTINEDSLGFTTWVSVASAFFVYLLVMTLRSDAFSRET